MSFYQLHCEAKGRLDLVGPVVVDMTIKAPERQGKFLFPEGKMSSGKMENQVSNAGCADIYYFYYSDETLNISGRRQICEFKTKLSTSSSDNGWLSLLGPWSTAGLPWSGGNPRLVDEVWAVVRMLVQDGRSNRAIRIDIVGISVVRVVVVTSNVVIVEVVRIRIIGIRLLDIRILDVRMLDIKMMNIRVLKVRVLKVRVLKIRVRDTRSLDIRLVSMSINVVSINIISIKVNIVEIRVVKIAFRGRFRRLLIVLLLYQLTLLLALP